MRVRPSSDAPWYQYDGDVMSVSEARELKRLCGMGLKAFSDGVSSGDVDALCFVLYLAQRRAGVAVTWRELDDLNIADMGLEDDPVPEPEPEPTTNGVTTLRPPRKGKKATTG